MLIIALAQFIFVINLFCFLIAPANAHSTQYEDKDYPNSSENNFLYNQLNYEEYDARYRVIKLLLDEYKRPFTLLDIDTFRGYYSLKAAGDYDAVCVIANPYLNNHQLIEVCGEDGRLNKLILLKKLFTKKELQHLSECECFDVVLAMNILQHFEDDWQEATDAILNMSDHIIIEIPNQENTLNEKQQIRNKELENYIIEKGGNILSSFFNHASGMHTSLYLISPGKRYLERNTWLLPKRKIMNYIINSSFLDKKLTKPLGWFPSITQTTSWVPGINLLTFKMCNGIYPTKETLKESMILLKDQRHTDWMANNMVVQGNKLIWIDTEDLGRGNGAMTKPSFFSEERLKGHFELIDLDEPQQVEHYFWYNLIRAPVEKRQIIKFLGRFLQVPSPLVFDIYTEKDRLIDIYLGYGAKVVCFEVLDKLYKDFSEKFEFESVVITNKKAIQEYMGNSNLDAIIALYGLPTFCNIHAPASEVYPILLGLTQTVPYLTFRFSNQDTEQLKLCIQYLSKLGYQQFNFSPRDYPLFGLDTNIFIGTKERWVQAEVLLEEIERFSKLDYNKEFFWGHIYAKIEF